MKIKIQRGNTFMEFESTNLNQIGLLFKEVSSLVINSYVKYPGKQTPSEPAKEADKHVVGNGFYNPFDLSKAALINDAYEKAMANTPPINFTDRPSDFINKEVLDQNNIVIVE